MYRAPKLVADLMRKATEQGRVLALMRYKANTNDHIRLHGHVDMSLNGYLASEPSRVRTSFVHHMDEAIPQMNQPDIAIDEEQLLCLAPKESLESFELDIESVDEQLVDFTQGDGDFSVTPLAYQNHYMLPETFKDPILLVAPNQEALAWIRQLPQAGLKVTPIFKYEYEKLLEGELIGDIAEQMGSVDAEQRALIDAVKSDIAAKVLRKPKI